MLIALACASLSHTLKANESAGIELQDYLPDHCVFTGEFSQEKTRPSLPIPINTSGQLYFSCQDGIIWQNNSPDAAKETLIFTNKEFHFRANKNKYSDLEVLNSTEIYSFASLLLALMSADKAYLNKSFTSSIQEDVLIMKPKSFFLKKALASVTVKKVDDKPFIHITLLNGNHTKIKLTKLSPVAKFVADIKEGNNHCIASQLFNSDFCGVLTSPAGLWRELRSDDD